MRWLLIATSLIAACGARAEERASAPLRIAAASSLTDVLPVLARELGLGPIDAHFDASSTLARQIEAGDEVDLFLSADARWAEHLIEAGLAAQTSPTPFATNRLVVVVPRASTARPSTLAELVSFEHVAASGAEVPSGRLARAALEHEGLLAQIAPRLVDAPNVRAALTWVTRGEAEAAIVFATDARIEPEVVVAFEVPPADYPAAVDCGVVMSGARETEARAFLTALTRTRAQDVLAAAGFGPPP